MFIHEIRLENLLSFGPESPALSLRPLNVLIGPNGSGKSNLIDAISLIQAAPSELVAPIGDGGGLREWLWKGAPQPIATLEVLVENPRGKIPLRHRISFRESGLRFELSDEAIENSKAHPGHKNIYFYYRYENGRPVLNTKMPDGFKGRGNANGETAKKRSLARESVDPEKSILAQRKDPDLYPEITYLGEHYGRIKIYRNWTFGRSSPLRKSQPLHGRNDYLQENCHNLGLILNKYGSKPKVKKQLLEQLDGLFPGITDFGLIIEGGAVQFFLQEGEFTIPAERLSDGTLRFLCLLAILCDPEPPPLVCIEEPELGLHPDVLPGLAELLRDASRRTQLVVTTHSNTLVDALSDSPEDVIVCEKTEGQTVLRRLEGDDLRVWLEKYSLGELWRTGEIGGNRW